MTDDLGILVFDGVEELDAVGPYDVFAKAASEGADWTVELLCVAPAERVTAARGLRFEPDGTFDDRTALDYLLVPGGGWNDRADEGAWAVAQDGETCERLRSLHASGTTILSVCTGAMVLATAGLLDGRPAVTHRGAIDELRASDAEVVEARVVDDGDVLTCGGVTAGIDLALWLVEREWGESVADAVATELEHERTGDVVRAE